MNESQIFQSQTRETLEQHRQIHFFLDQISLTLQGLRQGLDDPEPMRRLAAQLAGLRERLVEHHESEEQGGLFQSILEMLPDARAEVARLINQHDKMIEVLEMARLHAQRGEPSEADALRVDLEAFVDMFRTHEEVEEQLLRQAISQESQQGDRSIYSRGENK